MEASPDVPTSFPPAFMGKWQLWLYYPAIPPAGVFFGLFAIATTGIIWRVVSTKTWYCLVFLFGGMRE